MKTMPILIAMLMAGSALATDWPDAIKPHDISPYYNPPSIEIGKQFEANRLARAAQASQVSQETHQSSKVEYSLITLPSGETASVLTYK